MVEHNPRLHPRDPTLGIKLDNLRHVLGKVEHHRDVAALTGERGPAAAAKNGSAMLVANGNGCDYIVGVTWNYDCDRDLAIVWPAGGVGGAGSVVHSGLPHPPTAG